MGECKCCNDLGSSPKYQLCLTITVGILFLIVSLYGIALVVFVNADFSDMTIEEYDATAGFYDSSLAGAYLAGFLLYNAMLCFLPPFGRLVWF